MCSERRIIGTAAKAIPSQQKDPFVRRVANLERNLEKSPFFNFTTGNGEPARIWPVRAYSLSGRANAFFIQPKNQGRVLNFFKRFMASASLSFG